MDEQDLNSVETEFAPHETAQDVSQQDDVQSNAEAQAREQAEDRNWRAMRQRQKEMEMEIKQKNDLLERLLQSQQPQKQVIEEEPEEPDEYFIPKGRVKGIAKKTVQPLEKKIQELEEKIALQEQQKLMQSLRTQYSDFDDVVNVETLELLERTEPELASTISQLKDPYKMGFQSYKYIKALGLADKLPEARRKKEVIQKLDKSNKTVQTPQAFDKRPIAQAYRSTQADMKQIYEEMMFYASQANGL